MRVRVTEEFTTPDGKKVPAGAILEIHEAGEKVTEATSAKDIEKIVRAFEADLHISVEPVSYRSMANDFSGYEVEGNDRSEYYVFENEDDAEKFAIAMVKDMLEDEPELFTTSWLESFIYITDTDKRIIAGEEADARYEGHDDHDILEVAGKDEEYDELSDTIDSIELIYDERYGQVKDIDWSENDSYTGKELMDQFLDLVAEDLPDKIKIEANKKYTAEDLFDMQNLAGKEIEKVRKQLDDMFEKAKDELHDEVYEEVKAALDDPIEYFVREQGIYSIGDLMKASFINIDTEEAAKDAVDTDGVAHFLALYDGDESTITDPESGTEFTIYRRN